MSCLQTAVGYEIQHCSGDGDLQDMLILCGSRKYPYPPQGGSLEILRGKGVFNTKNFKGKYEAKLEFLVGCGGSNQKTLRRGSMDIFWNVTHSGSRCLGRQ